MSKPVLIFDYDGTIHNTMHIYEPAFRKTHKWLIDSGLARQEEISTERVAGWLGINPKNMWDDFQPDLDDEHKAIGSAMIGDGMAQLLDEHKAVWFERTKETLTSLKEAGYTMIVLSNCKKSYKEAHWSEFEMEQWFADFYECESYGYLPKTEIIKDIMKKYGKDLDYIVIGDRNKDMECAKSIGAPFIACLYGYAAEHELDGADADIRDISELPAALVRIENGPFGQ